MKPDRIPPSEEELKAKQEFDAAVEGVIGGESGAVERTTEAAGPFIDEVRKRAEAQYKQDKPKLDAARRKEILLQGQKQYRERLDEAIRENRGGQ